MEGASHTIVVDGKTYSVRFHGFHEPMDVYEPDGSIVTFLPWTYREHMDALRLSLEPTSQGLDLEADKFCRHVLCRSGLPPGKASDLGGLALWWACGGETESIEPAADGWWHLGPVRVRLKGWSNAERIRALSRCVVNDGAGESFDVVGYLDTMVRTSIETMDPLMDLDEFDPSAAAKLINAVLNLNAPDAPLPEAMFENDSDAARRQARMTLKLCAALGWTPSRVWSAPAAEIDRLLSLMDLMEPEPLACPQYSSRLTDYPDAVVIRFEDD